MSSRVKNKLITGIITLAIIVANFVFTTSAYAAISGNEIVSLTNAARVNSGLKPYTQNQKLTSSAYAKASDILEGDYFAHYSPSGKSPWSFIKHSGYTYIYAGENLAISFNSASETFNAWMASPTHKSNILDKDFTQIGVAVLTGDYKGQETTVVVQHFGKPSQSQVAAAKNQKNIFDEKVQTQEPKIDLDLNINQTPNIDNQNPKNVVWFSSPALFMYKLFT